MSEVMGLIYKLKDAEEKRLDLEYILKHVQSGYLEEANIETNFVTKDFGFDGNRMIKVHPPLLINFLQQELTVTNDVIAKTIARLGGNVF